MSSWTALYPQSQTPMERVLEEVHKHEVYLSKSLMQSTLKLRSFSTHAANAPLLSGDLSLSNGLCLFLLPELPLQALLGHP